MSNAPTCLPTTCCPMSPNNMNFALVPSVPIIQSLYMRKSYKIPGKQHADKERRRHVTLRCELPWFGASTRTEWASIRSAVWNRFPAALITREKPPTLARTKLSNCNGTLETTTLCADMNTTFRIFLRKISKNNRRYIGWQKQLTGKS